MQEENYNLQENPETGEETQEQDFLRTEPKKPDVISKIKEFFADKEKRTITIWSASVLAVALIVLIVCLYVKSDKVDKALKTENYKRVQVTFYRSMESLVTESEEETSSDETDEYSDEDYYNYYGDVYYDENGSMVTYSDDTSSEESDEPETTKVSVMKKDGDVYYEDGLSGESYYYNRDGQNYVLYYDDFYGIYADNGKWVESETEDFSLSLTFDFSVLENIEKSDLKKTDKGYVPKENADEFFYTILRIQNKENYQNCEVYIQFDNGKIAQIETVCVYQGEYEIVQTFDFTYKDESIEIPEPDVVAGEEVSWDDVSRDTKDE